MRPDDVPSEVLEGNAAQMHDHVAEVVGDALAIDHRGTRLSHRELAHRTASFAGGLREAGLEEGDRLLLYLPNCPQYLIAALGSFKAGTVCSPMNPQYKPREIRHQLLDSEARAIVTHAMLRDRVRETLRDLESDPVVITVGDPENQADSDLPFESVKGEPTHVDRRPDDVAVQPYTSGTTGRPKGVLLTHKNMLVQGFDGLARGYEADEIRSLVYLPLYHITGFTHLSWQPLVNGSSVFLRSPAEWDAEQAMRTIEQESITWFVGVTAMYMDMVNHPTFGDYDLSSLKVAGEGGAKMSVAVQEEFETTAGVQMAEGYGMTETAGATHSNTSSVLGSRIGTVGQPKPITDSKIVDEEGEEVPTGEEGELLVRGPHVMKGYHGLPEANRESFTEHGWLRTGDIARRDADNYYEIVDRKKHMIVSAGYNIYPSEVEELLLEHEEVSDAAVVGFPDERRNEVPWAFVVPRSGSDALEEQTIKQYCLDNLAEYKHPRRVVFLEQLPRTASGKVQKFRLREEYA